MTPLPNALIAYFSAEKRESWLFVALGVASIAVAVFIWRGTFRGAAFPLVAIGIIQIVVGGAILLRTDKQVATLLAQLASDPARFRAEETARMEMVMKSFAIYKSVEFGLLAVGLVLAVFCRPGSIAGGIGLGLMLQSAIMLAADIVAEQRGEVYLRAVKSVLQ